jgi:hypothetical protein
MEILCRFLFHVVSHVNAYALLCQLVYVAWLAVEVIFVYFFLIETKNKTLEECAVWAVIFLALLVLF